MPMEKMKKFWTEGQWKNRAKDIGRMVVDKGREAVNFAKDNPQAAALIVGTVTGAVSGVKRIARTVDHHAQRRHEQYHRDREVYDRSLGIYLTTRKKLTKKDIDRINDIMRKTGKKKSEVLSELGLLKR